MWTRSVPTDPWLELLFPQLKQANKQTNKKQMSMKKGHLYASTPTH